MLIYRYVRHMLSFHKCRQSWTGPWCHIPYNSISSNTLTMYCDKFTPVSAAMPITIISVPVITALVPITLAYIRLVFGIWRYTITHKLMLICSCHGILLTVVVFHQQASPILADVCLYVQAPELWVRMVNCPHSLIARQRYPQNL